VVSVLVIGLMVVVPSSGLMVIWVLWRWIWWWCRAADQDAVVGAGGSAVGPVDLVVGVAPGGGSVAVFPAAVFVAGDDRSALRGGESSGGAARRVRQFPLPSNDIQISGQRRRQPKLWTMSSQIEPTHSRDSLLVDPE
jgi:hypothetical protein